jgi:hypothetical protein
MLDPCHRVVESAAKRAMCRWTIRDNESVFEMAVFDLTYNNAWGEHRNRRFAPQKSRLATISSHFTNLSGIVSA